MSEVAYKMLDMSTNPDITTDLDEQISKGLSGQFTYDSLGYSGVKDGFSNLNDEPPENAIHSPNHYRGLWGTVECIDAIHESMTDEYQFIGYLRGNIIKYLWRFDKKGCPMRDLSKAREYLGMLMDVVSDMDQKLQE